MTPLLITLGVLALFLLIVVIWAVGVYNALVTLRQRYANGFSQIDVQLKRRYDLIPNLVEVAKGYLKHEHETLVQVIQARNTAQAAASRVAANPTDGQAMGALLAAEGQLGASMGRFFGLAEAYPNLKADAQMRQLHEELTSTENKIAFARQAYNDAVTIYNTRREVFPSVIVANFCNFQAASLYQIENAAERQAVQVKFT